MKNLIYKSSLLIVIAFLGASCSRPVSNATKGGLTGSALGAGLGAIIGSQSGDAGPGIAVGTAAGALAGTLIGDQIDERDKLTAAQRRKLDQQRAQIEENRKLIDELRNRGADARYTDRGVVINLPDILFSFDSANLKPEAMRTINEIAEVLQKAEDRSISVEGHTDSIGSVSYNKTLSRRRANSVARELKNEGISSSRISVVGYGEGSPIATNNSEEGRSRNRRVEVVVENTGEVLY